MLAKLTRYPATLFLLLASIAVRILCDYVPAATMILAFEPRGWLGWLGIVSHQFTHGNWAHLLGNFRFGLPFMAYLESKLGRSRLEEYFVLCGVCSALLQTILGPPGMLVGSSGAIFGCMVGACVQFGETVTDHCVALLFLALLLIPQLAYAAEGGGMVAFWGHVGGAIGGILLSHRLHRAKA